MCAGVCVCWVMVGWMMWCVRWCVQLCTPCGSAAQGDNGFVCPKTKKIKGKYFMYIKKHAHKYTHNRAHHHTPSHK